MLTCGFDDDNDDDNDDDDDDDDDNNGAHSAVPPLVDRPFIAPMVPLWFWFGTSVRIGAGWKMIIITIRKGLLKSSL